MNECAKCRELTAQLATEREAREAAERQRDHKDAERCTATHQAYVFGRGIVRKSDRDPNGRITNPQPEYTPLLLRCGLPIAHDGNHVCTLPVEAGPFDAGRRYMFQATQAPAAEPEGSGK